MDATQINEFQQLHVAAWNEKDVAKRDELLQKIYAEDITMYDRDFILHSRKEVSDFIGKLLSEDAAFNFAAAIPIDPLQNGARFFGHITTGQGLLNSMDFLIFENGKAKLLYAFMEPAK